MTIERIENTGLWQASLAEQDACKHSAKREELRTSLLKFRENASSLVTRVASDLPGLTIHDVSHLDALWETASLICGENYPLNPLEAFVFGGAVLLHDSALCFEAYDNGLDGVRDTVVWKDHYAVVKESNDNKEEKEVESLADFLALRTLHSQQAEVLANKGWTDPDSGQKIFLIENQLLRKHLGKLIGLIAASHHWNLDEVSSRLPNQSNALSTFPREWRIDPIKIACMLRCADAAHIDSERAPDFLHALLKRRGISYSHWKAQNKLACVDIDQSDASGETILFTSTSNFQEDDSESWWVCCDAASLVDKEIRNSNALLEACVPARKTFQVKKVRGVESPELMSKYIQTDGWDPCMAEIHVGNIEGLVNALGGEKLYGSSGDSWLVVIRELIQNSRDAIHARRIFDSTYKGRITIRLKSVNDGYVLYIEDDGIGMSKRVLTGPLLDFGTSFWTSSLVQSEFPGLRSSKFKSVGRFGIGFYSVFMCADSVTVASRPWNGGASDVWQLQFNKGLSLRPILKNSVPLDLASNVSTQVCMHLKGDSFTPDAILVGRYAKEEKNLKVSMSDALARICAGLDVSVFFTPSDSDGYEIHKEHIDEVYAEEWLKEITLADYQDGEVAAYIEKNACRLKPIIDDDRCYGYAAISTRHEVSDFLAVATVGGLVTSIHGEHQSNYIGYIDNKPSTAKREVGGYSASPSAIKLWAEEQVGLLEVNKLTPRERYSLATSMVFFELDPSDVAMVAIVVDRDIRFLSFEELSELSLTTSVVFLKSCFIDHIETHHTIDYIDGYALVRPLNSGRFLSLEFENGVPVENLSLLDCLYRAIIRSGYKPQIEIIKNSDRSSFGQMDRIVVTATK